MHLNYSPTGLNKYALLVIAILIGFTILWFTNDLVEDLSVEERNKVNIWAKATEQTTDIEHLDEDVSFVFEVINHNNTIPVILTNESGQILYHKNFPPNKVDNDNYLNNQLEWMIQNRQPIVFEYADGKRNKIYFKDSIILTKLRYFPYVILFVVSFFVLLAYLAFNASRRSEQNKVWAGMARETAHQIGTPLSSLMGWVTILQDQGENRDIAFEMNKDLLRLQSIAERFSHIGSIPTLELTNISNVLEKTFYYMKDRSSSKIDFILKRQGTNIKTQLNPQLFGWVIENIMRNAIDAIDGVGTITVSLTEDSSTIYIDVADSGKGIISNNHKSVFDPGYTTKKRGWGLGLSLVKRIVDDYHKGQVFVLKSIREKGTTFRIKLPKS